MTFFTDPLATKKCPGCATDVAKSVKTCPHCGRRLSAHPMTFGCLALGAFLLFVLALVIVEGSGKVRQQTPDSSPAAAPRAVVYNSSWDGSVRQVEQWLKSNLKDPGSLNVIEWGKVTSVPGGFLVRCKYRARNSFGGYVVEHKTFTMDSEGNVTNVADWR